MSIVAIRRTSRRVSIAAAVGMSGLLMLAGPAWAADEIAYPHQSIVMFVASWCAPCREELSRLSTIVVAARPWDVVVMAMDDTPGTRAMLASVPAVHRRWQPGPAERQGLANLMFQETGGLPFSIATDAVGRPCASIRSGLDAARVRQLLTACRSAG